VPYWLLWLITLAGALALTVVCWPAFVQAVVDASTNSPRWSDISKPALIAPAAWVLCFGVGTAWLRAWLAGSLRSDATLARASGTRGVALTTSLRATHGRVFSWWIVAALFTLFALSFFIGSDAYVFTMQFIQWTVFTVIFIVTLILSARVGAQWWNWFVTLLLTLSMLLYSGTLDRLLSLLPQVTRIPLYIEVTQTLLVALPLIWLCTGIVMILVSLGMNAGVNESLHAFGDIYRAEEKSTADAEAAAQRAHQFQLQEARSVLTSPQRLVELASAAPPSIGTAEFQRYLDVLRALIGNQSLSEAMRASVLTRVTSLESDSRAKARSDELGNRVRVAARSGWATCPSCGSRSSREAVDAHFHRWYFCENCGQVLDYSESSSAKVATACPQCGGMSAFKVTDVAGFTSRDYVFCSGCGSKRR